MALIVLLLIFLLDHDGNIVSNDQTARNNDDDKVLRFTKLTYYWIGSSINKSIYGLVMLSIKVLLILER